MTRAEKDNAHFAALLLDSHAVGGALDVLYGEDVVALLLSVARNVVERFTLGE